MLKSNIPPYRIGIPAIKMAKVEFTILLRSEGLAGGISPKYHGRKSRQGQPLPGNIRRVFCREMIPLVNFIL